MKFSIRHPFLAALPVAALLCFLPMRAQTAAPVEKPRATSTPYAGDLSIFEEPNRDQKLQIDRVMDILRITKGKAVADIGAGGGWFTVRAAKRVGSEGAVYAEDINPAAAKAIDARAAKEKLPQVHAVLGTADDLKLPAPVDAALLLKMYHEIANPIPLMVKLRASLKPGARVGIIDRNGNGADHGLKQSVLEHEMSEAGYRRIEQYDFTKEAGEDYFLVFVAK
ncbi:MAG: class I SAM-dependent methyltransferase [Janthinobacterium lividum]